MDSIRYLNQSEKTQRALTSNLSPLSFYLKPSYTPPISEPVDDGEDAQKNSDSGNQIEEPEQQKAGGHGVPELVPEWVDGQEYPQGEDEPVDDGTNVPSDGNQKEEPNQHNIG